MMDNSNLHHAGFASLFWNSVDAQGEHIALVGQGSSLTYAELGTAVSRMTNGINDRCSGAESSDSGLVAILCDHRPELVMAILGVRLSGRGYAPLDISFPEARLQAVTNNIEPEAIIVAPQYEELARRIAPSGCAVVTIDELLARSDDDRPEPAANLLSPAYLLSTSGTTGEPKSIMHNELSMLRAAIHYCNDLDVAAQDNIGLVVPCTYTPSVFCIFGAMIKGATLSMYDLKSQEISEAIDWIERDQVSLMYCSPTIFRRLIGECEQPNSLASLRSIQLAGEPLFKSDVDAYRDRFGHLFDLYNGMGTSETSCLSRFFIDAETLIDGERVPVGRPYDDVEFSILDAEGEPVVDGEEGDLVASSAFIAEGYWNRPDLSKAVFSRSASKSGVMVYRTGDRARRLPDGNIVHLGRSDDQLKLRGQRVELGEIEATAVRSGLATTCAAVLIEEPDTEPFIAAFFAPKADVGAVRQYLSSQLPAFMIPTRIVALDALPNLSSGKVDRKALKTHDFNSDSRESSGSVEVENIVEQRVLECFQAALKKDNLNVDSDFFNEGGDSLRAVELAIKLEGALATPINVSSLIEAPTPRKMALVAKKSLSVGSAENISCFRREQEQGGGGDEPVPLFCLPGLFGDALSFRALAAEFIKTRSVYVVEYAGADGAKIAFDTMEDLVGICFDAITSVYPEGPIALVCYSSGGAVGHALAGRFKQAGREISLLAMIDCYSPRGLKLRYMRDTALQNLKALLPKREHGVMQERYEAVNKAMTRAIYHYRPERLAVDNMMLIVAKEHSRFIDDYREWNELMCAPFETVTVEGSHLSLIMPERAPEVANLIEKFIPQDSVTLDEHGKSPTDYLQAFTDIWSFQGAPELNLEFIDADMLEAKARSLLNVPEQLTSRAQTLIGEPLRAQLLTSRQVGRKYNRKVALITETSNRVAWVAAISIAMDRFSQEAIDEILKGSQPFGSLLSERAIDYQCRVTSLFRVLPDRKLEDDFGVKPLVDPLFGRSTRFTSAQGETLADVFEILAPRVVSEPLAESA